MNRVLLILLCLALTSSIAKSADTLFVSVLANPGGDGQSWATAYATVDASLAAWQAGDEIWVARGTYTPPVDGWAVKNGMHLYGGFNGNELLREERDWYRRFTTLSSPGVKHAFHLTDCDSSTRIDGFVITQTTENAILVTRGCPRIVNIRFRNNTGASGAAILADGTTRIHVEYCVFGANMSDADGGAVTIRNSGEDPYGWGAFIAQCLFYNNTAVGAGGALFVENSSTIPQVTSCVFTGNKASNGGAISTNNAYLYLLNSTFYSNQATATGEDIAYTLFLNGGNIVNCIVWNGDLPSSAMHITERPKKSPEDSTHITPVANLVEADFVYGFWQANPLFENEDVPAGPDGFLGTDDDGLRLSAKSISRDAGFIDSYVNSRQTDVIGNPRLVGRKVDLGAYEGQRAGRLSPPEMVAAMKSGAYSLFYRHAKTDWASQDQGPSPECFPGRNLIYEGRDLATEIGKAQRLLGIPVVEVSSSPVCRCWETALLMRGTYEKVPLWGSGGGPGVQASRDSVLKTATVGGNRVITSHDAVAVATFNPDGDGLVLTSAELMEADNLFVKPLTDTFEVVAHWCADTWIRYHVRFPDTPESVGEIGDGQGAVACFPNPASTLLGIEVPVSTQAQVVNLFGNVMWEGTVHGTESVRVDSWPPGAYFVVTSQGTRPITVIR